MSRPHLLDFSTPRMDVCASTQDICRRLALEGAPEGTTARAREQTRGRGREGRLWESKRDAGLWMSFILRPRCEREAWPSLTALVALAAAEALEGLGPEGWRAGIKWPNDLHGQRGKLGGILAETVGPAPTGEAVVVGLGINLAQEESDFSPEVASRASSLRLEGFAPVPEAEAVARAFNASFAPLYESFQEGNRAFLQQGLRERFYLRSAVVRVACGTEIVEGTAIDVGPRGELICDCGEGAGVRERRYLRSLVAGEVLSFQR